MGEQGRVFNLDAPLARAYVSRVRTRGAMDVTGPAGGRMGPYSEGGGEGSALERRLVELREEHRAMDAAIEALQAAGGADQLQIARLKKRKLALRDQIGWIEDRLNPDIIA